jgi:hypothetical protein
MANLHCISTANAAVVGAHIHKPRDEFADHTSSAVFREMTAVIVAALGLTADVNILLFLLHIGPG